MLIIKHRVNWSVELNQIDPRFGIEVDVRTYGDKIVVSHDPFNKEAEEFKHWINHFKHKILVINVKEEGIEKNIDQIMNEFPAIDYFFLDQSFPFLVKKLWAKEFRTAIRFSDLESVETLNSVIKNLSCKPNWIWIDDFTGQWEHLERLKAIDLSEINTCIVSPELHGRDLYMEGQKLKHNLEFISPTAICTKDPEYWEGQY